MPSWVVPTCRPQDLLAVRPSDLQQFALFVLHQIIDLTGVGMGGLVEFLLGVFDLVLARLAVLFDPVQLLHRLATDIAHGHPGVLSLGLGLLHELAAAFLGELGNGDADDVAVVAGVDAEVGIANGVLDRLQLRLLVGLDDDQPGFGNVDAGQLGDRRRRAVVVDREPREHARVGAARADGRQVVTRDGHRLLHLVFSIEEGFLDHGFSISGQSVVTSVPIFSPATARAILPSMRRLNTRMGMPLSMHRLNAVASATARPRSMTSRWVIAVISSASGLVRGSAVNTPPTALAIRTTSAPISSARCAAVVSVEKYGRPMPAPKITTRPFSRCLWARSGM